MLCSEAHLSSFVSELLPAEGAFQRGYKRTDCLPCRVPAWERPPERPLCGGHCRSLPGSRRGAQEPGCPAERTALAPSGPAAPHWTGAKAEKSAGSRPTPEPLRWGGREPPSEEAVKPMLRGSAEKSFPGRAICDSAEVNSRALG